jgi:hypothetical protein
MLLTNTIDPIAHNIGDEIWQTALSDAIRCQAEKTAHHVPPTNIRHSDQPQLVDLIAEDMTAQLRTIGDTYTAVDGVIYTLREPATEPAAARYAAGMSVSPVVVEATFEQTPDYGPRRAIVRWSDGTTGEAVRWFPDELLVCEGDLIGKTQEQIRTLHHRRDRDWLQS